MLGLQCLNSSGVFYLAIHVYGLYNKLCDMPWMDLAMAIGLYICLDEALMD